MASDTITVNGRKHTIDVDEDTPLLWVIRDTVGLTGTKYGCGVGECGACSVVVNGSLVRSCAQQISAVDGAVIQTIEGLSSDRSHPVQRACIAEQVPQCGWCHSGQMLAAVDLLNRISRPTDADISQACRRSSAAAGHTSGSGRPSTARRGRCAMTEVFRIDRRDFLEVAAGATGALVLGVHVPFPKAPADAADAFKPNVFLTVEPDGRVVMYTPRPEMGQGSRTGLKMNVADELEVPWDAIEIRMALAGPREVWGSMTAGGSTSIRLFFGPLCCRLIVAD